MTAHEYPVSPEQRRTPPAERVRRKGIGEDSVSSGNGDVHGDPPVTEE